MILLITRMITDRIGLNSALLPLLICSVVVFVPLLMRHLAVITVQLCLFFLDGHSEWPEQEGESVD